MIAPVKLPLIDLEILLQDDRAQASASCAA